MPSPNTSSPSSKPPPFLPMSHDAHHAPVASKLELAPERSDLGLYRPDRATGWRDWLTTVDHKKIGVLYGAFAMLYFLIGGVEALEIGRAHV